MGQYKMMEDDAPVGGLSRRGSTGDLKKAGKSSKSKGGEPAQDFWMSDNLFNDPNKRENTLAEADLSVEALRQKTRPGRRATMNHTSSTSTSTTTTAPPNSRNKTKKILQDNSDGSKEERRKVTRRMSESSGRAPMTRSRSKKALGSSSGSPVKGERAKVSRRMTASAISGGGAPLTRSRSKKGGFVESSSCPTNGQKPVRRSTSKSALQAIVQIDKKFEDKKAAEAAAQAEKERASLTRSRSKKGLMSSASCPANGPTKSMRRSTSKSALQDIVKIDKKFEDKRSEAEKEKAPLTRTRSKKSVMSASCPTNGQRPSMRRTKSKSNGLEGSERQKSKSPKPSRRATTAGLTRSRSKKGLMGDNNKKTSRRTTVSGAGAPPPLVKTRSKKSLTRSSSKSALVDIVKIDKKFEDKKEAKNTMTRSPSKKSLMNNDGSSKNKSEKNKVERPSLGAHLGGKTKRGAEANKQRPKLARALSAGSLYSTATKQLLSQKPGDCWLTDNLFDSKFRSMTPAPRAVAETEFDEMIDTNEAIQRSSQAADAVLQAFKFRPDSIQAQKAVIEQQSVLADLEQSRLQVELAQKEDTLLVTPEEFDIRDHIKAPEKFRNKKSSAGRATPTMQAPKNAWLGNFLETDKAKKETNSHDAEMASIASHIRRSGQAADSAMMVFKHQRMALENKTSRAAQQGEFIDFERQCFESELEQQQRALDSHELRLKMEMENNFNTMGNIAAKQPMGGRQRRRFSALS